ncbi:MAG TPA: acyl-ACP desaturase [Acidimicrobiia bacterium]|nr:acyl-ACP desaturase [Acidimicrobiia bacterium]
MDLARALAPTVSTLLDRHLERRREWFPHLLVPWTAGRDFEPDEAWEPADAGIPEPARSALFLNLLTEDNLPFYFHTLTRLRAGDAWDAWTRTWTAEEGRHAIVIRDYMTVTRAVDPVVLERARMAQVSGGVVPEPATLADALAYVALQELATRISHRNTGKLLDDRVGYDVMARVASDENLHFLFYRDLATAALDVDRSTMVCAIDRQVRAFAMPGTGVPDFERHARAVAAAGVYDFSIHHAQILIPVVLQHWRVAELDGLTDHAERARDALLCHVERVGRAARRLSERREERVAARA